MSGLHPDLDPADTPDTGEPEPTCERCGGTGWQPWIAEDSYGWLTPCRKCGRDAV